MSERSACNKCRSIYHEVVSSFSLGILGDGAGTGEENCWKCDGEGKLKDDSLCHTCNGKGKTPCSDCGGSGWAN